MMMIGEELSLVFDTRSCVTNEALLQLNKSKFQFFSSFKTGDQLSVFYIYDDASHWPQ